MTQSLAEHSAIWRATPNLSPTFMKPENSKEGLTTSHPSPTATSTQITSPPTPMIRLPLTPAQAARQRSHHGLLLPNKLRAQLPPLLRRGRHPSQVHNVVSSLPTTPQPHIQTPQP